MLSEAQATVRRLMEVLDTFAQEGLEPVVAAAEAMARALAEGKKILVFGNGGSAADAQHLAAELINRFQMERPPLPALALTTDSSVLTSIGNDYQFEDIFAKQIKGLGVEGDIALGLSTSGRSPNVLKGLAAARGRGLVTIGLSGGQGGSMPSLCDLLVLAPDSETARVQEVHCLVIHLLCGMVDSLLFGWAR